jgi:hypothetical protein
MNSRRRVNSTVIRRRYLKTVKAKTLASRQGRRLARRDTAMVKCSD